MKQRTKKTTPAAAPARKIDPFSKPPHAPGVGITREATMEELQEMVAFAEGWTPTKRARCEPFRLMSQGLDCFAAMHRATCVARQCALECKTETIALMKKQNQTPAMRRLIARVRRIEV